MRSSIQHQQVPLAAVHFNNDLSNGLLAHFRSEVGKERLIAADLNYLRDSLAAWWAKENQSDNIYFLKLKASSFFLANLKDEHLKLLSILGLKGHYVAAVCFANIFSEDCPKLSLVVHEALSDLFHLNDIKYPYKSHKSLYLKASGADFSEWGNGGGKISPHSDDLYEEVDTVYLSLTVCRDYTKTPTQCYFPKDIFKQFNDQELSELLNLRARFLSGKNVNGRVIDRERGIVEYSEEYGINFNFDFRVDSVSGERMLPISSKEKYLFDKLRASIKKVNPIESYAQTGTFIIVANHKVLHARSELNSLSKESSNIFNKYDYYSAPRLLYRSKGSRKENRFECITEFE